MASGSFASASALLVLLFIMPLLSRGEEAAAAVYTAGFDVSEAEINAAGRGKSSSCAVDFSKISYAEVTSVCKGPKYEEEHCCAAFKKVACKYPQLNDFTSTCPIEFMAYLNYAGNYPNGIFVGRCTSGNSLCS